MTDAERGAPSEDRPGGSASQAVSWQVRVAAAWTWRLLVIGVGIYVLLRLFDRIELVAFSFVLALFFTAVLHPLEILFRRLPGGRSVSSALALVMGLLVLAGIATFVAWQITTHSNQLSTQISDVASNTRDWLRNGPLHLKSGDIDRFVDNLKSTLKAHQGQVLSSAIATVTSVVEGLGALLLILLSTFFLLRDGSSIWRWTVGLFPKPAQDRVDRAGRVGWHTLGGYMRGQVLIALFHGVAVMITLFVLQVPLAAALGVLIFLGSFVPIVGLTVAGAFAVAVALLEHGLTAAIVVAVAIVVLVQLEAHLLQPLIMSRSVEVHPLAVALAVLTGTVLYGIVGALLAVPLVAFLNATVHALRDTPALPVGDSRFPVRHRDSVGGDPIDVVEEVAAQDTDPDTDQTTDRDTDRDTGRDDGEPTAEDRQNGDPDDAGPDARG